MLELGEALAAPADRSRRRQEPARRLLLGAGVREARRRARGSRRPAAARVAVRGAAGAQGRGSGARLSRSIGRGAAGDAPRDGVCRALRPRGGSGRGRPRHRRRPDCRVLRRRARRGLAGSRGARRGGARRRRAARPGRYVSRHRHRGERGRDPRAKQRPQSVRGITARSAPHLERSVVSHAGAARQSGVRAGGVLAAPRRAGSRAARGAQLRSERGRRRPLHRRRLRGPPWRCCASRASTARPRWPGCCHARDSMPTMCT